MKYGRLLDYVLPGMWAGTGLYVLYKLHGVIGTDLPFDIITLILILGIILIGIGSIKLDIVVLIHSIQDLKEKK